MKKILGIILSASIFTTMASAAVSVTVEQETVTVSTDITAGERADIFVVKKGLDKNDNENIFAMQQEYADEEGNIAFIFNMPDMRSLVSSTGEYEIFIKPQNGDMITSVFAFVNGEEEKEFFNMLNSENADLKVIFDDPVYNVMLKALGSLIDEYAALSENGRLNVINMVNEAKNEDFSRENFAKIFNSAIVMENLGSESEAKRILALYSPIFEELSYKDMEEERKNWIAQSIVAYKSGSVSQFENNYNIVNSLYVINNARFDKLPSALEKYEDILGIASDSGYKEYKNLTSTKKDRANEQLAASLFKSPAKDAASLLGLIEEAVAEVRGSSGSGSGGSGNSGGGSGSGSSGVPAGSPGFEGVISPSDVDIPEQNSNQILKDLEEVSWAKEAISALFEQGIVSGDENGYFNPNNNIKREEFIKMLVSAIGVYDPNAKADFDDVSEEAWYYSYVASAFLNKIAYGVSETSFGAGMNITRQDMAVMAYRAAKDHKTLYQNREPVRFGDDDLIADYAKEAVTALYAAAVISGLGDGNFNPISSATRAEAAVMIYNLFIK